MINPSRRKIFSRWAFKFFSFLGLTSDVAYTIVLRHDGKIVGAFIPQSARIDIDKFVEQCRKPGAVIFYDAQYPIQIQDV